MFENLLGNIKKKFAESQEKKRLEKEEMDRMQREVDFREKQVFQEEFKKNALKIAIGRAKEDAAKKSGMQKLVALNRVKRLQEPGANDPSNFFSKLSAYTQRNIARREENIKRTEEIRNVAKKMQGERKNISIQTPGIRKPFQPSGFGNR